MSRAAKRHSVNAPSQRTNLFGCYVKFFLSPASYVTSFREPAREMRLNSVVWLGGKQDFCPEDLHEIGVAFENCCAAIPEAKSEAFREQLALRLMNWAGLGKIDGTQLYMRALHTYCALQRL